MVNDSKVNVRLPKEIVAQLDGLPESNSELIRRAILLFLEQDEVATLEILNAKIDKLLMLLEELKP